MCSLCFAPLHLDVIANGRHRDPRFFVIAHPGFSSLRIPKGEAIQRFTNLFWLHPVLRFANEQPFTARILSLPIETTRDLL
jgi:hypothetical protein